MNNQSCYFVNIEINLGTGPFQAGIVAWLVVDSGKLMCEIILSSSLVLLSGYADSRSHLYI